MATLISQGNATAAAQLAMTNSGFYNVTLRNFIAPATNRAQSAFVPLNDYTATVIGMIRDNVPFNQVLSGDILYVGNTPGAPAYAPNNNNHYQYLDDNGVDLSTALVQTTQSSLTGIPSAATAGVITTEAAAQAFFIAGTNRATMPQRKLATVKMVMHKTKKLRRPMTEEAQPPSGSTMAFETR